MPNNNNKTNPPQRTTANQSVNVNSRRKRENLSGTAIYRNIQLEAAATEVCAITNPFCDASKGSKWPDESASQTLAIPIRMRYGLVTDANGACGGVFTATYNSGILPGTMSGGNWVWDSAAIGKALQDYAPAFTGAEEYRLVSGGIKVTPITSAMNSQGIINIIELPPANAPDDYATINTLTKNYPSYESMPLKSHDSIYAIMRPNGANARIFNAVYVSRTDTSPLGFTTYDWTSLLVNVAGGAPNETVAIVDIYLNLEVTIKVTDSLGYLMSPSAHANTTLTSTSANLLQSSAIYKGNDSLVDQSFMSRAMVALKGAGSFVGKNFKTIANVGAAMAHAYYGNGPAAAGHLMMLNDRTDPRMVD